MIELVENIIIEKWFEMVRLEIFGSVILFET